VIRRPRYACRAFEEAVVQAPAPARLIEGGLPSDALVAQVLVSKYADHLPLYRQAQIFARQGVCLDRSTLADWVGRAAFALRPVHERLLTILRASGKLFADATTAPVLDPARGRAKTRQLWAYARDDRPWGGRDPPGVAYVYAPDRTAERPLRHPTSRPPTSIITVACEAAITIYVPSTCQSSTRENSTYCLRICHVQAPSFSHISRS
jgi:transposase